MAAMHDNEFCKDRFASLLDKTSETSEWTGESHTEKKFSLQRGLDENFSLHHTVIFALTTPDSMYANKLHYKINISPLP